MNRVTSRDLQVSKSRKIKSAETRLEAFEQGNAGELEEYTVGRGRPPKQTQFKRGTSGNPRGRPRGVQSLSTIVNQTIGGRMKVTIGGQTRVLTKKQVLVLQAVTQAVQGDQRALFKLLDIIDELERREAATRPEEYPLGEAELEVIRAVYDRINAFNGNPANDKEDNA